MGAGLSGIAAFEVYVDLPAFNLVHIVARGPRPGDSVRGALMAVFWEARRP